MNFREVGNGRIITIITVIIKVVFVFKNYFQKIKNFKHLFLQRNYFSENKKSQKIIFQKTKIMFFYNRKLFFNKLKISKKYFSKNLKFIFNEL